MKINFDKLLKEVKKILNSNTNKNDKLQGICKLLKNKIPYYDWVGFYLVNPGGNKELLLGPYEGEPTIHERISFGEGICGQAADKKVTFVVRDVKNEKNYLSCSPDVKSEIVVPIFQVDDVIGELDIDSHTRDAFRIEDKNFLEAVSREVSRFL